MTREPFRLPSGGRVNRSQRMTFSLDGRSMGGFQGDTLAAALLANGVRLVGRSFKYHRPRGFLSAESRSPMASSHSAEAGAPIRMLPAQRRSSSKVSRREARMPGPRYGSISCRSTRWLHPSCPPASTTRPLWVQPAAHGCSTSPSYGGRQAWDAVFTNAIRSIRVATCVCRRSGHRCRPRRAQCRSCSRARWRARRAR